jgi:hypothetical protein
MYLSITLWRPSARLRSSERTARRDAITLGMVAINIMKTPRNCTMM